MKAGTTSLHHYLSLHPEIHMSRQKELSFFDSRNRWKLGVEWYRNNFDNSYPVNGESSPQYARYPLVTGVPERIKTVLASPKIIYMVRDPVERIMSHYVHLVDWRQMRKKFHEILLHIESDGDEYLQASSYFMQISRYATHFPPENILVVVQERLNSCRREELRRIFRFLGVDELYWNKAFDLQLNKAETKRLMSPWFDRMAPDALKRELHRPTWVPWRLNRAIQKLARFGGASIEKPRLSMEDDLRLQAFLSGDVARFREFLSDPLPEWRPYA